MDGGLPGRSGGCNRLTTFRPRFACAAAGGPGGAGRGSAIGRDGPIALVGASGVVADRLGRPLALAALVVIALLVAVRLGVFSPYATVETAAGPALVPNGLAGVDHPFHVARAEVLRRSLLAGEIPRWIGNHQQGYPVEFYPLGAAWLALGAWALSLGTLPIEWAHGVAVAFVLLLPGLAFWLLARRDGLPMGTAVLALAAHVAVPGAWWHGGYTELVQWGLVTNVAGAAWATVAFALLVRWVADGRGIDGALAMAASALAVLTNPRSGFGLAVLGLAAVAVVVFSVVRDDSGAGIRTGRGAVASVFGRAIVAGAGAGLLAAPELVSLARFSGFYVFKHYGAYADAAAYLQSSVTAVSLPVFVAAAAGIVLAWTPLGVGRPGTRAAALALPLYAALTWAVASGALPVGQLEPTRLMPVQRLLTVWLAAAAVGMVLSWLSERSRARSVRGTGGSVVTLERSPGPDGPFVPVGIGAPTSASRADGTAIVGTMIPIALGIAILGWWLRPGGEAMPVPGPPDAPTRGLYQVARTADPSFVDLERAVREADAASPAGTAILVLGSALSWHEQLWAPMWSERPFLYDDWLWFWRSDHAGTPGYSFDQGHFYPDPERSLDRDYLDRHGIGAIVATGPAAGVAATIPWLEESPGNGPGSVYRSWRVVEPTTVMTVGGEDVGNAGWANGRIVGTAVAGGEALIRQAWFPRWRALVDDRGRPPERLPDGTMRLVDVPAGGRVVLRYETDVIDWAARVCAMAGIAFAIATASGWRRPRFSRRPGKFPAPRR